MADYAISNVARRVVYTNTGVGPYAFTFEVLANTDIAVYRGSTLLTLTTDYSVTINANGTGSVTLVTAGTGNITIVGARAIQRTSDYTTGGDLFASTLNTDLDSLTIFAQQVAETAERGLKAPVVDPTDINMTLPSKTDRISKYLAFDGNGNPVATSGTGASVVSTTMEPVVSAATLATGRTNFGLGTGDSPQFAGVNVGSATDTTITRSSAGVIAVEGSNVLMASNIGTSVQAYSSTLASYASGNALGFKNRIINGAMVIDQRNAGAAVTATGSYAIDRWLNSNATDGTFSAQQDSSAPAGFTNSLKITITSADSSLGGTQGLWIQQNIEGNNLADLNWGSANAKTITISFWVRSSLTGTFGGAVANSAYDRGYAFTYTISSANTWEYKTVTIAGDTTGTWLTTNGIGFRVQFGLGVGSTFSASAGAWSASLVVSATGATSVVGTNGATFYITGVQLEVGSTATSFDYRPYGTELGLCQRYYFRVGAPNTGYHSFGAGVAQNTTNVVTYVKLPVTMRTVPTGSYGGTINLLSNALTSPSSLGITATAGTYVDALRVDFVTSGQTTAGGICAYTNNTSSDFIQFSAEL